ncbi:MAG: hypothetical protein WCC39_04450, partial [Telluria sp.]
MRFCLRFRSRIQLCLVLLPAASMAPTSAAAPRVHAGAKAELAVLETTDLHSNVLGYDYFKLAEDP